jgi:hypothetical protein
MARNGRSKLVPPDVSLKAQALKTLEDSTQPEKTEEQI